MDLANLTRGPGLVLCASGAVQCGREGRVGVDVQVLFFTAVDKIVLLDVCEHRVLDLGEGVQRFRAVATLVAITREIRRSG